MTAPENHGPLWTHDQAIAFEAALETVDDVIVGYSEQIDAEENNSRPDSARVAWLNMRADQATEVMHSLNVTDTANVQQVVVEYSAMVRARDTIQAIWFS